MMVRYILQMLPECFFCLSLFTSLQISDEPFFFCCVHIHSNNKGLDSKSGIQPFDALFIICFYSSRWCQSSPHLPLFVSPHKSLYSVAVLVASSLTTSNLLIHSLSSFSKCTLPVAKPPPQRASNCITLISGVI